MIKYIQIFGERRSGTNYLASLIERNFVGIEITRSFGGKHWFIRDHYPRCRPNETTDYQCVRRLSDSDDTLFLVIYRNPFDWLRSIHAKPFHAGGHWNLTFSEFLRKRWVSFETTRAHHSWRKNDRDYYFIEEAGNVVRLRSQKISHLNNLEGVVKNLCFINYEGLVRDPNLIAEVAGEFRIRRRQSSVIGEPMYFEAGGRTEQLFSAKRYPPISPADLEFIEDNLDWEVERSIHYRWSDYR